MGGVEMDGRAPYTHCGRGSEEAGSAEEGKKGGRARTTSLRA